MVLNLHGEVPSDDKLVSHRCMSRSGLFFKHVSVTEADPRSTLHVVGDRTSRS